MISDYNLLEDRPDRENEDALDRFLSKLRAIKTQKYEQLFCSNGANRVLRITITKTFVSRHDFEATYHELYKSKDFATFKVENLTQRGEKLFDTLKRSVSAPFHSCFKMASICARS